MISLATGFIRQQSAKEDLLSSNGAGGGGAASTEKSGGTEQSSDDDDGSDGGAPSSASEEEGDPSEVSVLGALSGLRATLSHRLEESQRSLREGLEDERRVTDHVARGEVYEGPYVNGRRHGDGVVCTRPDGSKFLGSYRDDEPHAGTLVGPHSTYSGTFRNGEFDGTDCRLCLSDGTVYEGEFRRGRYDGAGKLSAPDGSLYTGTFERGERHGIGTLMNEDGSSYSGAWAHDAREGEGTETLANGEVYRGQLQRNRRHGAGSLASRDGTVREGVWRAGVPIDGPGWTITYPDGAKYVGCAVDAKPHGIGTFKYTASGTGSQQRGGGGVYNGEFRNGVRHGHGMCVFASGETFDGLWVQDEPVVPKNDEKGEILARMKGACLDDEIDQATFLSELTIEEEERTVREEYGEVVVRSPPSRKTTTKRSPLSASLKDELKLQSPAAAAHAEESGPSFQDDEAPPQSSTKALHTYPNGDTYHGLLDAAGRRQGRGLYTERRTGSTYEGDFLDDRRHGRGVLLTACAKYDGSFRMDKREGEGTLVLNDSTSYNGEFKNNAYHGRGTLCDSDGRVYVGSFAEGLRDGDGEETYADGTTYLGSFRGGKRNGIGKLREAGGVDGRLIYSGRFVDDLMDGEGIYFYETKGMEETVENEDERVPRFEGTFVRGQREGAGSLFCADGTILDGRWRCDEPLDGAWEIKYKDGSTYSGVATWGSDKQNRRPDYDSLPVPNGVGEMKYANGDEYKGSFVDGKREGHGVCLFSNGDKWDGTWNDDQFGQGCIGTLRLADGSVHMFGHEFSTEYDDGSR